jgi:hypothetical protein
MPDHTSSSDQTFHLGITMAGAASAGCYTAGVVDYLFELLDCWQKAKERALEETWGQAIYKFIPPHEVVIDVIGGASAGGMTAAMTSIYALQGKINPVREPAPAGLKRNNVFYDSWVLMGDDAARPGEKKLFERTLDTSDLEAEGKIASLLNSNFLDAICEDAFAHNGAPMALPPYVSPYLEVLLSHTMLQGLPLEINFTTPVGALRKSIHNPAHSTFEHFVITHFVLNNHQAPDADQYLWLQPFAEPHASLLKLAAKATGAFPLGLRFREFGQEELSEAYIKNVTERIVFGSFDESRVKPGTIQWPKNFPRPYRSATVDGGAINNEPFGEVLGVLKNRYGQKADGGYDKYALVMIDPFPDAPTSEDPRPVPEDIFGVAPAIIGTLWEQSRVKRAEMLDAYGSDYYRGMIFPAKWKTPDEKDDHPIASASAMAFGGFLDESFRQHDFFLGRDNARNFFRFYFTLEYDPANKVIHPIHRQWTDEMVDYLKVERDGKTFLPIVPDLYYLRDRILGDKPNPYQYTIKDKPQYDPVQLMAMYTPLRNRALKILELSFDKMSAPKQESYAPMVQLWMNRYFRKNLLQKISNWIGNKVLRLLFRLNKKKLAGRMAKAAIKWILKDLDEKGLLKK